MGGVTLLARGVAIGFRIASMKGINGAIIGRFRSHCWRAGGAALANA
jgi:hypothetical protein